MCSRVAGFLNEIGIPVVRMRLHGSTFLPGIRIDGGRLLVDEEKLLWPGDLLHEAGHLALMRGSERSQAGNDAGFDPGLEMAAIAWSWAASVHLQLPPSVVFHPDGYRGDSESLAENFVRGHYVGVPLLEWMGLTSAHLYPQMQRWLRD